MGRYETFHDLRQEGLTYQEIADRCGCSKQNVAQVLEYHGDVIRCHRTVKESACTFPGLRNWLNEQGMCIAELCRQLNVYAYGGREGTSLRSRLRGKGQLDKDQIDMILDLTGKTYEEIFREVV